LLQVNSDVKVILMGDFNDSPTDRSVLDVLKASPISAKHDTSVVLYNMAYALSKQGRGSHKFQEKWDLIDQMMVTSPLLFP
jgi:endonuclease/exonuclease/phosphatase family metal-dependent hydrolase